MVKNYRNCIIATVIAVFFLGCSAEKGTSENSGTHSVSNPESRHIAMIETAPEKLQVSSLVAGASVSVEKNLVLESSYAAVSVWGEVNAPRTMTAGQNLDINSINRIQSDGAVFQAVDISSAEYKNAYILSENGIVIEFTNGNSRNVLTEEMPHAFQFINGQWMVSGEEVTIDKDVYVAGDLSVNAKSLKVSGIVAVQGDLNSEGDMDITVGSPFKYALIVNGNLKADSLSTLGRVNINGRVSVENDIIVTGSLESRDEIVCNGNMTIKSLDLSYMSAKQVATRELGENTLVSSQVFRDFSGRYSVAFFTYVKGHCDLDEEKLFDLIENNQTDSYEFCNVIVGASSSSLPELAWYNGISVYYLNKLKIRNSYTNAKVSDARSITNTTLYLSYTDEKGEAVGTFLVDGHSDDGEINEFGLVDLTKEAAGIQFEVDVSDDYKTYLDYKNSKWEKVAFPRLDTKTINLAYARKVMGLPSGTLLNHGFNVDALTSYNYSSIYSSLMVMKKLGIRTYNYQGVAGTVNRWYDENGWENRAIIFD